MVRRQRLRAIFASKGHTACAARSAFAREILCRAIKPQIFPAESLLLELLLIVGRLQDGNLVCNPQALGTNAG